VKKAVKSVRSVVKTATRRRTCPSELELPTESSPVDNRKTLREIIREKQQQSGLSQATSYEVTERSTGSRFAVVSEGSQQLDMLYDPNDVLIQAKRSAIAA